MEVHHSLGRHLCLPKHYGVHCLIAGSLTCHRVTLSLYNNPFPIKHICMLDSIIKFSIKNKLVIGMLTIMLICWGIWSATKLPIDAVPDITNNQVQIITTSPRLAGQEVEQLVTFPIEQSIANLPGIEEVRSISRFGLSVVTVVFAEDVDTYFARQLIAEKLKEAEENIPEGVGKPELAPVSTGLGEVYQYIIRPKEGSEDKYTSHDLREMQDWIVARQLNGTPGVAEINSFGGELKQYEVAVNPFRLRAMGVSIAEIFDALERNNQNTGGAYIDKKPNAYFIRGIGIVTSLEDVRNISVKNSTGEAPILIKDVADVRFGSAVRYGALSYNGEVDAVGGVVMMLKGENSNEVVKRVKAKIPTIQQSLPQDIIIEPYLDRTELVGRAIGTVERNLIEGALIVIFVLVLFLGNMRAGLIVASAIPLSLLFALGMMNVFGVSANLMSLGAIDFGLIVDGAVIIVEATLHHLATRKSMHTLSRAEMDHEVYQSASKIRSSAAFGEIIILIVYIPILTLVGIEGKMFRPMAQTVGFAILGALILSLTYIPMMCALFLSGRPMQGKTISDRIMERLQRIYTPILERAIELRRWIVGGSVILFLATLWIFSRMGGEFIPQLREGDFAFHCILPQGTSLSQSMETSMYASRLIKEFDEVKMVVGKTGSAEVPTDPMPPEGTDIMVILHPQEEWASGRSYDELAEAINEKLSAIPGVFIEHSQPIQMRFNELMTGVRQDVAVKIFGENLDTLVHYADKVSAVIASVEGATAPQVERIQGLPQINVEYDRTRLANYGLSVSDVNDVLSAAFAGRKAGVVFENERRFDLVVRLDSAHRRSIEDVADLMIPSAAGQIPVFQVAKVSYQLGPAQISREEGKRRVVIGFNVAGRDVQSLVDEIRTRLETEIKLPSGYYFTYGGQFENLQKASNRLMLAVPLSLFLILSLLYFTFGSLRQSALIFTAIPMSAIGGVLALLVRDMPFSISAGIGFITLFGVAVLNGIVLISTFNHLRHEGLDLLDRVREGTRIRLRPVLMTALVASFGFLPMALSTSSGAEVQKPLATVVIGGLITATLLTLIVLPLLYMMLESYSAKRKAKSMNTKIIALVFAILLPGTYMAVAQEPTRLTLEEVVRLGLERHGGVQASALEAKATRTLRPAVYDLPKLNITGQLGQYSSIERDQSISLEQSIPFPTLFGARRRLAQAEELVSLQRLAMAQTDLRSELRLVYSQIQILEHRAQLIARLDSMYADFGTMAQVRYRAGDVGQVDVTAATAKRGQVAILLKQNEADLATAYARLATLVGLEASPRLVIEPTPQPMRLEAVIDTSALEHHPSLEVLRAEVGVARGNKQVELHSALPDLTIGYTNQSLIGNHSIGGQEIYYGPSKRFSFFSLGVSIPLNIGASVAKVRSWEYKRQAALASVEQRRRQLSADLTSALEQYRQAVYQYDYYRSEGLANARTMSSAARDSYRAGEIGYMEYLYAIETATEIEASYLESIHQLNQTIITIHSYLNR